MSAATTSTSDRDEHHVPQDGTATIFFDGECGLCNRLVQFVVKRDSKKSFLFAPLQGSTFAKYRNSGEELDLSSMVLVNGSKLYTRSDASLRVLRRLGGIWGLVGALGMLAPRFLRDPIYSLIAANRHRLVRRSGLCTLASGADTGRFLP